MEKNVKKYEFIKNGIDDYTLKYKDKEIKFHSKVSYVNELQNATKEARNRMIMDLAEKGKSVQMLIVKKEENGKIIYDHSNVDEMEKGYVEEVQGEIFNQVCKDLFGMDYVELATELELTNEEEAKKLGEDIGRVVRGEIPRE